MKPDNDKKFLEWLKNRLINKYHEDDLIVNTLDNIIKTKLMVSESIDLETVEKICNKIWPNFDGTNSGDIIGITEYTEPEKEQIKKCVTGIILEYRKGTN